jgi:hypothetical protein
VTKAGKKQLAAEQDTWWLLAQVAKVLDPA